MYDFQNEIKLTPPCLSSFSPHTEHKDIQRPLQLLLAQQEARRLLQISQPDRVQQAPTALGISAACVKCLRALMSLPKHTRPVHEQKYQMLLLDISFLVI